MPEQDIVELLRGQAKYNCRREEGVYPEDRFEWRAADEIERLRGELFNLTKPTGGIDQAENEAYGQGQEAERQRMLFQLRTSDCHKVILRVLRQNTSVNGPLATDIKMAVADWIETDPK